MTTKNSVFTTVDVIRRWTQRQLHSPSAPTQSLRGILVGGPLGEPLWWPPRLRRRCSPPERLLKNSKLPKPYSVILVEPWGADYASDK